MIFAISVCILVYILYYYVFKYKFSRVKEVAVYPYSKPLLGNCLQLTEDMHSVMVQFGEESINNDGIVTVLFGPVPVYVISDPIKATTVLSTCLEKNFVYRLINPLFGDTLVSAKGSVWKRNRKILDLAFKAQVLEGYMDVFNNQAFRLLQMIDEKAGKGDVDITDDITKIILETTCQTTMGLLPNNQMYINDDKYVKAVHKVFEITTLRIQKIWLFLDSMFYFSRAKKDLDEALSVIFDVSAKMVALRKSEYTERIHENNTSNIQTNGKLKSYLDIVIENSMTEDGCIFTDTQLRYLCDNVLLAAFDTTTYEVLFTLVCIGSDEEVQRKIYEEIQDVLGEENTVRKEHLSKLVYLEAAIKEAIRLYPIGPMVGRKATENVRLGNITLPAGSEIVVHLWAINRSKTYWGADAEEFKPDRWFNPDTLPKHHHAFGSFSFGRRNCIGKLYAMMAMKTILVPVLRRYRIIADHKKMELECYAMLKARGGHLMQFELR